MRIPEFIRLRLRTWAHKKMQKPPDFIIRPQGKDQTLRWWVIPRNRFLNIYLHKFVLSDEDRALHDHPWINASILIEGSYIEHTPKGVWQRHQGFCYFRRAKSPHRVQLWGRGQISYHVNAQKVSDLTEEQRAQGFSPRIDIERIEKFDPVTTLFITGPKIREWGFLCPKGWRHWKDFCDSRDHGIIGRGCE